MLRLWSSLIFARIFIGEGKILVCIIQGKLRPKIIKKIYFEFVEEDLSVVFIRLKEWLNQNFIGKSIEWILSMHYVRHITLPWSKLHLNSDFSTKVACELFNQQFHEDINKYEIKILRLEYKQPLLACFFDKKIVLLIQKFIEESNFKNVLIESMFHIIWNRFYSQIKQNNSSIFIIDGGRLLIIQQNKGKIQSLSLRPFLDEIVLNNSQKYNAMLFHPTRQSSLTTVKYLEISGKENTTLFSYPLCGVF